MTSVSPLTFPARLTLLAALVVVGILSGFIAIGGQQVMLEDGRPALSAVGDESLAEDVAFTIGDEVVTRSELQDAVDVLSGLYGIVAPEDPDEADAFRRDTAKAIAVSRVLAAEAVSRGIEVTDEQVEQELMALVTSAYEGDRDRFVSTLGDKGVSEDDVRAEIRNQLQNVQLFNEVTEGVAEPTDEAVRAYYDANRADLVDPVKRALANIVVGSKESAQEVLRRLRSGTEFAALARRVSLDGQTRDKGGSLGTLAEAQLDPAYARAAFASPIGQPFGPVQTQSGWNVGLARSEVPARQLTFDEVRESIAARLLDDARQATWSEFLVTAIKAADITYADEFRPDDPDAPPADDLGLPEAPTDEQTGS